jgi:hypothetical protein
MKRYATSFLAGLVLLAWSSIAFSQQQGVQLGDSMERVKEVLGQPRGQMDVGQTVFWSYNQGVVKFEDGKVIESDLISKAEAAEKDADRIIRDSERQKRLAEETKEFRSNQQAEALKQSMAVREESYARGPNAKRGDTPAQVKKLFGEPDLIEKKGEDTIWCYDKGPSSSTDRKVEFNSGVVVRTTIIDWGRNYPHIFHPSGRFIVPFAREKSSSAKYLGAVPIEFATSKAKGYEDVKLTGVKQKASQNYFFKMIATELRKHPVALREGTIQYIYAAWYLKSDPKHMNKRFFAMGYMGGIAGARTMCLSKATPVHHEFGHMLQYSYAPMFPSYKWQSLFKASNSKYGIPKSEFVSAYAKSSDEEDFAEMMEVLFSEPETLFRVAEDSPVLQQKLDLVLKFYADIVEKTSGGRPNLDLAYFRRLQRGAVKY